MQIIETNLQFNGELRPRRTTKRIIIHHSATDTGDAYQFHQAHLNRGWSGLGYNYVILKDGTIQRGRPENTIGAHAGPKGNPDSIGVNLVGNFMNYKPTPAQIDSLVWLIHDIESRYGKLQVIGHKDVMATACPGRLFPWEELFNKLKGESEDMFAKLELKTDVDLPEVNIKVNGREIDKGVILNVFDRDTSYAPVRAIAEALGAKIGWDAATRTVLIER